MGLTCGIVGLPNVGKTTIYGALTGLEVERTDFAFSTTGAIQGTVEVPDPRMQQIAQFIPPQKIVPAQLTVVDIPGLVSGSSQGEGMGTSFLGAIKESDVLLHVIRCFDKVGVEHSTGALDPAGDAEIVDLELGQSDLETLARNIDRVRKKARTGDKEMKAQQEVFEKAKAHLETDEPLRSATWTDQEVVLLKPLFLMTIKHTLYIANVGEGDQDGKSEKITELREYAQRTGCDVLPFCGDIEAELVRMDEDDRAMMMEEFGLKESGLNRLIHAAFGLLGLQTYFTAGEMEIRAWVIHKGDTAPIGASVIHTDFLKKFIRAEVYSVAELVEYKSEAAIKQAGKMRVEGKNYVLQDGDVCHFLIGN